MSTPAPTFSPLYLQIKRLIMQSLESAEWRPGEAIPSEIELAARYKVSQGTVRKAIDELAAEKHLLRRQGKGTFVATHDEAGACRRRDCAPARVEGRRRRGGDPACAQLCRRAHGIRADLPAGRPVQEY